MYLGFITEGKLAALLIKPSLGVSNWLVIYIINYTPIVFWHHSTPRHHYFTTVTTIKLLLLINRCEQVYF
jgi:hypothetical protein